MSGLTAPAYFERLKAYLEAGYVTDLGLGDAVTMKEKVQVGDKKKVQEVSLGFSGKAIVVNLDKKNGNGNTDRLFHFLDDTSKPWAKRCDFVVFQCVRNGMKAYLFEFKSKSLAGDSIRDQLQAGAAWCRALHATINHYTGHKRQLKLTKYVLTLNENPEAFLCADNKYLNADHSVRLYRYDELKGLGLEDLDNDQEEVIR